MTDRLKPCPFCGGEYVDVIKHDFFYKDSLYEARCYKCHFGLEMVDTEEEAIKAWNTRKPMDRIVEQLEKEKSDWNDDYNVPINNAIAIVKGCDSDDR